MRVSVAWVDGQDNAVPEERATVGDLEIHIGEHNVSANEEDGELDESLFVSVYGLAEGLAHEWWRLVGSRDPGGISFREYRDGYLLPDLRFFCDGQVFHTWAERHEYDNPVVRFAACPEALYERAEFEGILARFIDTVRERLQAKGLPDTPLEKCWQQVLASKAKPDEVEFCEAAGALRLDPYLISDEKADFIFKADKVFKGEALLEFLSGIREVPCGEASKSLDAMSAAACASTRLADLQAIAAEVALAAPESPKAAPWLHGHKRAAKTRALLSQCHARTRLGMKPDVEVMASWFGAAKDKYLADRPLMVSALRQGNADKDIHISLQQGNGCSGNPRRRFAFAQAIGDAICYPKGGTAAIIENGGGYRQAATRAFAAEFLAPQALVQQMQEDGKDPDKIANDLAVPPEAIYRQQALATIS